MVFLVMIGVLIVAVVIGVLISRYESRKEKRRQREYELTMRGIVPAHYRQLHEAARAPATHETIAPLANNKTRNTVVVHSRGTTNTTDDSFYNFMLLQQLENSVSHSHSSSQDREEDGHKDHAQHKSVDTHSHVQSSLSDNHHHSSHNHHGSYDSSSSHHHSDYSSSHSHDTSSYSSHDSGSSYDSGSSGGGGFFD